MATVFPLLALCLILSLLFSCSANLIALNKGFHLSVENPSDVLISPNKIFSAGFHSVGRNAYCFAIWFTQPNCSNNCTVVWMANRDVPVNGRHSKLSLLKTGNLVLTDAGQSIVWETKSGSASSSLELELKLQDNGNLVLHDTGSVSYMWQSFDSPTDTLLPQQLFTGSAQLVSSRSQTNFSSGFYKFYFDNDNVLRLLYHGLAISSVFWPDPGSVPWEIGRTTYNSSKAALLDSLGNFTSSDNLTFMAADYGVRLHRRLKLDFDGNLRIYSRQEETGSWDVTWQVLSGPCTVHGICGPNSVCSYHHISGRKCSCIPGFKMVNQSDWAYGCEQMFDLSPDFNDSTFLRLPHVEFYGYDFGFFPNTTLYDCSKKCLERSDCKGFQFKFDKHDHPSNLPYCFAKTLLLNGRKTPDFLGDLYLKVPKVNFSGEWPVDEISKLNEWSNFTIARNYKKRHQSWSLKFLVWFALGFGLFELLAIIFVWFFLLRTGQQRRGDTKSFFAISGGFKRFTYNELKKATNNFKKEIGRGAGGVVYKGILSDKRVAAIKRLNDANQGEAEFLAEISTIGNLNHMNLIDMWGYCVERNCRLLVYEYVERGSLAENLSHKELDWKKRFEIAVGTAKGLAYLHEECLEWVLHCDVKPQNILLDINYNPKVSDFGLSRLISRDEFSNSGFSAIRGTRGYMAPEWVFKLPITSKVDVYSYGVVVLEMVTGKNPAMEAHVVSDKMEVVHQSLVAWIREKRASGRSDKCWIKDIVDATLGSGYDSTEVQNLVEVALQCVEESSDARPSMRQVIEMLLQHEIDH